MLTIYKASAGSGKTYTLAYEYIKLLLGIKIEDGNGAYYVLNHKNYLNGAPSNRNAHRRILAITFTNKATAEMKSRIIKQLEALTHVPESDDPRDDAEYAAKLMADFGCRRDELQHVALRALRSLLNDYGQFNVSTIDAFFQTILRSFAREIDRQGDYRLELEESTVIGQAVAMMFDELNTGYSSDDVAVTEGWLDKIAMERVAGGDDFNPFNSHSRMYRQIIANLKKVYNDRFLAHEAEMYEYLADRSRLSRFESWLRSSLDSIEAEEAVVADSVELNPGLDRYVNDLISKIKILHGLKKKEIKNYSSNKSAMKLHDAQPGTISKKNATVDEDLYFRWFEKLERLSDRRERYSEMLSQTNTLLAFVHIRRYIDRYRVDNNMILISDTNSLLSSIVTESDTPFIYERVGMSLENFLIDEFQDTSRQQWRSLRPLVANSGIDADSLIIGDVKKSIYRWRGGDPALLASEVQNNDFPASSFVKGDRDGENTNYRSAHELVRFNNTLFHSIAQIEHVSGYEGVAQSLGPKKTKIPAYINITDLGGDKFHKIAETRLPEEFNDSFDEETNKLTDRDVSLKLLAESILDQVARGYRFNEIAILCRGNKTLVDIAEYLVREYPQIKIVSDEALLLCNNPAVKLIISMLEIIDKSFGAPDSAADESSAEVPSPLDKSTCAPDSDAEAARRRRTAARRRKAMLIDSFNYYMAHGKSVEEAMLMAVESSRRAVNNDSAGPGLIDVNESDDHSLEKDLERIRLLAPATLSGMVEAIISVKFTEQQRMDAMPYLTAFIDFVDDFSTDNIPSIHSFLNYWHDNERAVSIIGGENVDAVAMMTVHKAKGLEWPCVHIPFMNWRLEGAASPGWYEMDRCTEIPADIRPPLMYITPSEAFQADDSPFAAQINAELNEQKNDNLNVAYVAFTRAGRELNIHMMDIKKSKRFSMADAMRQLFAMPCALPQSDLFTDLSACVDDDGNYRFGTPTTPIRENKTETIPALPSPGMSISFNPLNKRLTRLSDLTAPDDHPDDPDIGNNVRKIETTELTADSPVNVAARHGIILHSILSQMVTLDDLDHAIAYHTRDYSHSELAEYRRELERAFEIGGEQARSWFSADNLRVLNEQPVFNAVDGLNNRLDRIVWTPDGRVIVIDYKFTTTEKEEHIAQVREYIKMLSSALDQPVSGYLWYPTLGHIRQV